MSNLVFAWPYASLIIILLYPMLLFATKRQQRMGMLMCPMATTTMNMLGQEKRKLIPKPINWFLCLVWILLTVSLMRPQFVGEPIQLSRDGRNIMLVLDLSESMELTDMERGSTIIDRLDAAKEVIDNFIDQRGQDRLGLVVFGSEAFLHAPLSFDHPMIKQFLADAQIGFAGPKTAIGDALGLGIKKLMEQAKGEKVLVLLTDGQNNMGSLTPRDAAGIAQQHNVKIYIVGLGASRLIVDGFFGPQTVNPSLSLDEAQPELKEIAESTGGKYFRAKDPKALQAIYEDINRLEPEKSEPKLFFPKKEIFFWPLSLMVLMMVSHFLWSLRKSHAVV